MDLILPISLPRPRVFLDPEEYQPNATNFFLEQLDPATLTPSVQAQPWVARPFIDEEIKSFLYVTDEDWLYSNLVRVELQPWLPAPYLYDETSTSLANFALDLEEPPWQRTPTETVTWLARPFTDDEISTFIYVEDEQPYVGAVEIQPWLPRPYLDDEISTNLANFGLEYEHSATVILPRENLAWLAVPFSYDETTGFLYVDDEQPWVGMVETIAWRPVPYLDDEISSSLKNFALDQEERVPSSLESVPWLAHYYIDEDLLAITLTTIEDEAATPTPRQPAIWVSFVSTDEHVSSPLKNFGLDQEDNPQTVVQVVGRNTLSAVDEDLSVTTALEEADYRPMLSQVTMTTQAQPYRVDEDLSVTIVSDEEQVRFDITSWLRQTATTLYDDETAAITAFGLDQEDYFPPAVIAIYWWHSQFSNDGETWFVVVVPPVVDVTLDYQWLISSTLQYAYVTDITLEYVVTVSSTLEYLFVTDSSLGYTYVVDTTLESP